MSEERIPSPPSGQPSAPETATAPVTTAPTEAPPALAEEKGNTSVSMEYERDAEGDDADADGDGDGDGMMFEEDLEDIPFGLAGGPPAPQQNGHGPFPSTGDLSQLSSYPPSNPFPPIAIETSSGPAMPSVFAPMPSYNPNAPPSSALTSSNPLPLPPLQSLSSVPPAVPPRRPRGRPRKVPGTESRPPRVRKPAATGTARRRSKGGKRGRAGSSEDEDEEEESDSADEKKRVVNMQQEMPDDYDPESDKARAGPTTKFGRKITKPAQFVPGNKPPAPRKKKATNPDAHLMCQVCKSGHSQPSNLLVICDSCSKGWHQICHSPPINEEITTSDLPWLCKECDIRIANSRPRIDVTQGEWTSGQGLGMMNGSGEGGIGSYTIREKTEWLEGMPLHSLIGYILSIEQKYSPRVAPPGLQIWPQHLPKVLEQARANRAAETEAMRLKEEESVAESDTNSSHDQAQSPALARTIASRRMANLPSPSSSTGTSLGQSQGYGHGIPPPLQHRPQSQNQSHPIPLQHRQSPNPNQHQLNSSQKGPRPPSQQSHRSSFHQPGPSDHRGPPPLQQGYSTPGGYPPQQHQQQQQFPPMRQRSTSPKPLPPYLRHSQFAPVPALQPFQNQNSAGGHRSGPSSPLLHQQQSPNPSQYSGGVHSPQLHSPQLSGSPQMNSPNQSQFAMQQQQQSHHHQLPPPQNRGPPPPRQYQYGQGGPPPLQQSQPPPQQQHYSPNPSEGNPGSDYRRHSTHSSHSYDGGIFEIPPPSPSMGGNSFYSPLTASVGSNGAASNGAGGNVNGGPLPPPPGHTSFPPPPGGPNYSPNPAPYYYGQKEQQGPPLDHWGQPRSANNPPPQ